MLTHCTHIAFQGTRRLALGSLEEVALAVQGSLDTGESVLAFEAWTGRQVDLDLRGTREEVRARYAEREQERRPGRPKLGVVPREVTLLPRHWEWLSSQPGGASVALRKLVEEARRANEEKDRVRLAREAAHRFMTVMAGNEPGFEEAMRALFSGDRERFGLMIYGLPDDVQAHVLEMVKVAFQA
ncbi:MAG: DUF2239 family protein [Acidobacteria bacterium]|nr:DUF2239 family protein [Acidobacteriota bacterium]